MSKEEFIADSLEEVAREAWDEGDIEGALEQFNLAMDSEPFHRVARLNAVSALLNVQEPARARELIRQYLEVFPDDPEFREILNQISA